MERRLNNFSVSYSLDCTGRSYGTNIKQLFWNSVLLGTRWTVRGEAMERTLNNFSVSYSLDCTGRSYRTNIKQLFWNSVLLAGLYGEKLWNEH